MSHAKEGERTETAPARPAPLPRHVIEALTADVREAARRVLTDEERSSVVVSIDADEHGHFLRVRGESELVDRIERELFPDDQPDGQAVTTSSQRGERPGEAAAAPAV